MPLSEKESSEKLLLALSITEIPNSDYKIFLFFDCLSNRCNRYIIVVIRDFWALSEISKLSVDNKG